MHPTAALSATLTLFCAGLLAQPGKSSHCDPLVDVQNTGPGSYKERGDRCEGQYEQKVSGSTGLRIASLTDTYPDFKFAPGDQVHLAWTIEGEPALRLRAISLRSHHYYRMDSARPTGKSEWVWPAEVLAQHGMGSRELGLVGITRRTIGTTERDVYIPIKVARAAAAHGDRAYMLVVTPMVTLRQLFLTITPLQPDGVAGDPITDSKDVQQAPYPSRGGVRIPLPPVPKRGYYTIELSGVTDASKPVSVELTAYLAR
jgi:hypothetical protein